jgi:hypothetical protein
MVKVILFYLSKAKLYLSDSKVPPLQFFLPNPKMPWWASFPMLARLGFKDLLEFVGLKGIFKGGRWPGGGGAVS